MPIVGFQDLWVTGSRFYFQRDPIDGVEQPWIDIGTIQVANPELAAESIELRDPDGGTRRIVATSVNSIDEVYTITSLNLNPTNLSLMFMGEEPEVLLQIYKELVAVPHFAWPERLLKLKDESVGGEQQFLYDWDSIFGVVLPGADITTLTDEVTAMTPSATAPTIATATDLTGRIDPGDCVIVHYEGLANGANAGSYQVLTVAANLLTLTSTETIAATESGVTVDLTFLDRLPATDLGRVLKQRQVGNTQQINNDWEIVSETRGLIKFLSGGSIFTKALYGPSGTVSQGATLHVYGQRGAGPDGEGQIFPQSASGSISGTGIIVWSRDNNARQTIREMKVTISPAGAALNDEDYSNIQLQVRVVSDVGAENPAGRLIQMIGNPPDLS